MARLSKQFESTTVEWPTPDTLWGPLHEEFGFTLDVCATAENTKCSRYYTKEQDGLLQPWSGVCWMNPPYGRGVDKWLGRANAERTNGVTTVALIPARTNTGWWHDIVSKNEVRFVRGRPKFGNADQGLPWPLAVVVFKAGGKSEMTVGTKVEKVGGDYTFEGWIVSVFTKRNPAHVRYVVEDDRGVLHVYSAKNLRVCPN